jgi:hypothetical protein
MLRTPVSGSLVTHTVAVKYGAASKPGVEIGTGKVASPPPGRVRSSPVITTSWQGASSTKMGGIGLSSARSQISPRSWTLTPMPMA